MATFLVTGGCGFIGSHLVEALAARGDTVRVVDDLSTGRRENLPDGVQLVVGDVADAEVVARAMQGVRGCFHLAAIASVVRSNEEWRETQRVNLGGAVTVFEAATRAGGVPVVYASSAAVYGDCAAMPLTETSPVRPLSAYGADKLGCELHARVGGIVHGLPTCGLRFFNVYGPRQDPSSPYSGVISIFLDRVARGTAIDVFGDGRQVRDFIYVTDVVAALLAAVEAADASAPVVNVCTGLPTSILDLAATVIDVTGRRVEVNHRPPRSGDIPVSIGDPSSLRTLLGVVPTTTLADGLALTRTA